MCIEHCLEPRARLQRSTVGGGYTKNNVARCWTNETAILVGKDLSEDLPQNLYQEYFQPDYKLNRNVLSARQLDNQNIRSEVDAIRVKAMEHLRHLSHTPGELFQSDRSQLLSLGVLKLYNKYACSLSRLWRQKRNSTFGFIC